MVILLPLSLLIFLDINFHFNIRIYQQLDTKYPLSTTSGGMYEYR